MVQAMRGAARALRNSDHVDPGLKTELIKCVMNCWVRVCQILTIISPILAKDRYAAFEGMGFILDETFNEQTESERLHAILCFIPDNVVNWFQEDIFSKKLGALLSNHVKNSESDLDKLLSVLITIKQRPPGWEKEIENFIINNKKNSYYLFSVYDCLFFQYKTSFSSEKTRQQLRKLTAMSLAKHNTGAKHPNIKLVEKTALGMKLDAVPTPSNSSS